MLLRESSTDKAHGDLVGIEGRITQLLIGEALGEPLDTEDGRADHGSVMLVKRHLPLSGYWYHATSVSDFL